MWSTSLAAYLLSMVNYEPFRSWYKPLRCDRTISDGWYGWYENERQYNGGDMAVHMAASTDWLIDWWFDWSIIDRFIIFFVIYIHTLITWHRERRLEKSCWIMIRCDSVQHYNENPSELPLSILPGELMSLVTHAVTLLTPGYTAAQFTIHH